MKDNKQEIPQNYYLVGLFIIAAVIMGYFEIPYYGWMIVGAFLSADVL